MLLRLKKLLSPKNLRIMTFSLCLALVAALLLTPGMTVAERSAVTYGDAFPDVNFQSEVLKIAGNGKTAADVLTDEDIAFLAGITELRVDEKNIADLTGIEYFSGLTVLNCFSNRLTTLDLSNNPNLIVLQCYSNQLTELDVSHLTNLINLGCGDNLLSDLDVSNNIQLTGLAFLYNQITQIDLSQNTALQALNCDNNSLANLNITNNTALEWLSCAYNDLTVLDLSKNNALTSLSCAMNELTSLDVTQAPGLTTLWCYGNKISSLNLTNNPGLITLWCTGNQLESLDVSANTALVDLSCQDNQLESLDVSANTTLKTLWCNNNKLTELVVSGADALEFLWCHKNSLGNLNVRDNTALILLNCSENPLTSLDVTANTALTYLNCSAIQLSVLDVTQNTLLSELQCAANNLSVLNLGNNPALAILYCQSNPIRNLDTSNNPLLTELWCSGNGMTLIDVSKNTALKSLWCNGNDLMSLDLTNNTALTTLWCSSNKLGTLNVTKNTALVELDCAYNSLAALDLTQNTALTKLSCQSNVLASLNLTQNTLLTDLLCHGNNWLTELDLSKNTALSMLNCSQNRLTELDISQNTALTQIVCYSNRLTALDVTNNPKLTYIHCTGNYLASPDNVLGWENLNLDINTWSNPNAGTFLFYPQELLPGQASFATAFPDANFRQVVLALMTGEQTDTSLITDADKAFLAAQTTLDLSGKQISRLTGIEYFTGLTSLNCSNNLLVSLNLSQNPALESLICSQNWIIGLDLRNNRALTRLECQDNLLTTLYVSQNAALEFLSCQLNQLITLDLSGNLALTYLGCQNNTLLSLDVSRNTALGELDCSNNRLTALNVTNNPNLARLSCYNNYLADPEDVNGWQTLGLVINSPANPLAGNFLYYNQLTDPVITITTQPLSDFVEFGGITTKNVILTVAATVTPAGTPNYAWYQLQGTEPNPELDVLVGAGNTLDAVADFLPKPLTPGVYYIYSLVSAEGADSVISNVAELSVRQVSVDPFIEILVQPEDMWVTEGNISGSLRVVAVGSTDQLQYQWNRIQDIDDPHLSGIGVAIPGATEAVFNIPMDLKTWGLADGKYYYICRITGEGDAKAATRIATVTVRKAEEPSRPTYAQAFPDAKFRQNVLEVLNKVAAGDRTEDSPVTKEDQELLAAVKEMDVARKGLTDLTGIAYFTGLTLLDCSNNQLTALDVSANTELTVLNCSSNQLTALTMSGDNKITVLHCSYNKLTSLDVSGCAELTELVCGNNQLPTLDVSGNTSLATLYCNSNLLDTLDVTNNTALNKMAFYECRISAIDLTKNAALTYLECWNNPMTRLDVTKNLLLTHLYVGRFDEGEERLIELDVTQNTALVKLECWGDLTTLNVSRNTELTLLNCQGNQLTTLDVSKNTKLEELRCGYNALTKLDISQNQELLVLFAGNNQLTELDVTNNAKIYEIRVANNNLTQLDLSQNKELSLLNIEGNKFTELDLAANTNLAYLWCPDNKLAALDVTMLPKLTQLYCQRNSLTQLDLAAHPYLDWFFCYANQLTELDVSQSPAITRLYCYDNLLTELDVSNNSKLALLYCNDNYFTSPEDVIGSEELGLAINSPDNLLSGAFRYYNQKTKPVARVITITTQPEDLVVKQGEINSSLSLAATTETGVLLYQWYQADSATATTGEDELIDEAVASAFPLPASLTAGSYYYYCVVSAEGLAPVTSRIATVTVESSSATPVTPTKIEITTAPEKTAYRLGEALDLTGLQVTVSYSDNTSANVTEQITAAPADGATLSTPGQQTVTLTYTEGAATLATAFQVSVAEPELAPVLDSITVTQHPAKTVYEVEEELDLTGLTVTAQYSDQSTANVTTSIVAEPADGYILPTPGWQTVTLSYTEDGKTVTTTFSVQVGEEAKPKVLDSISIDPYPNKTTYQTGDKLDLTGWVVTAHFSDHSTADVSTSVTVDPPQQAMFLESGPVTIKVSYTYQGATKSVSFTVNVSSSTPDTGQIQVTVSPLLAQVRQGETLQLTATVTGADNPAQGVTWSLLGSTAAGTTISTTGLLTVAPEESVGTALTITAISDVDADRSGSGDVTVIAGSSSSEPEPEPTPTPTYGISLDVGEYVFPAAVVGYNKQAGKTITVTNTGNQPTGELNVGLTGQATAFVVSDLKISSLATGESKTFTVEPAVGLAVGSYQAIVTILGDNEITGKLTLRFTVNAATNTNTGGNSGSSRGIVPTNNRTNGTTTEETTLTVSDTPLSGLPQDPVDQIDYSNTARTAPSSPFEDVTVTDWFFDPVTFVHTQRLMTGVSTEPMLFAPNQGLTRGMVVTILHRLAGSPAAENNGLTFVDVPADAWFADGVKWASAYEIVFGYGNGYFGPSDLITREQLAAIIYRNIIVTGALLPADVPHLGFTDEESIAGYAQEAVNALVRAGFIAGRPDNTFDPQGTATRAEMAAVLSRM